MFLFLLRIHKASSFNLPGTTKDILINTTSFSYIEKYPVHLTNSFDGTLTLTLPKCETNIGRYYIHSLLPQEKNIPLTINLQGTATLIFTSSWTNNQYESVTINKGEGNIEVIRHEPNRDAPQGAFSHCISVLPEYCPQNIASSSFVTAEKFITDQHNTGNTLFIGRDPYDDCVFEINLANIYFDLNFVGPSNWKVKPHVHMTVGKILNISTVNLRFQITGPTPSYIYSESCSVASAELNAERINIDPETLSTFNYLNAKTVVIMEEELEKDTYAEIRGTDNKATVNFGRMSYFKYFKIQEGKLGVSNYPDSKTLWVSQEHLLAIGITSSYRNPTLTVLKDATKLGAHCHFYPYDSNIKILVDCDTQPFMIRNHKEKPVTFILTKPYTTMTHFEAPELIMETTLKEPVFLDGKFANFNNTIFTFKSSYINLAVGIFGANFITPIPPFTINHVVGKESISSMSFGSFFTVSKHITANMKFTYEFNENVDDEEMKKVMSKAWDVCAVNISTEGMLQQGNFEFPDTKLHGFFPGNYVFEVKQRQETSGFKWIWTTSLANLPAKYTTESPPLGFIQITPDEVTNIIQNPPKGVQVAELVVNKAATVTFDGSPLREINIKSLPSIQHTFNGRASPTLLFFFGVRAKSETGFILSPVELHFDSITLFSGNVKIAENPRYNGPLTPFQGPLSGSSLDEVTITDTITSIKFMAKERTYVIENSQGTSVELSIKLFYLPSISRLTISADENAVIDLYSLKLKDTSKLDLFISSTNGKVPEITGILNNVRQGGLTVYTDGFGSFPEISEYTYPIVIQNAKSKIEMGNADYFEYRQFEIQFDEETSTTKTLSYNEVIFREKAMVQPYPQHDIIIEANTATIEQSYDLKMKAKKNLIIGKRIKEYVVDVAQNVDLEVRFDSQNMPRLTIENPPKKAVWFVDDSTQEMEEYSSFFAIDKIIIDGLDHQECDLMLSRASMTSELSAYNSSNKESFVLAFWCEKYTPENSRLYVGLKGHTPPERTTPPRTPHPTKNPEEEGDQSDHFVKYTIGGGVALVVVLLIGTILYKKCGKRQSYRDDQFFSTESIGNYPTENPLGVDHFID